jgi:hypothetical protein
MLPINHQFFIRIDLFDRLSLVERPYDVVFLRGGKMTENIKRRDSQKIYL